MLAEKTDKKKEYYSIGKVVEKLRTLFSDITISKVRFLEDEGLIKPERTESGYRKFNEEDIRRLTAILKLQKEQYLPLSVIKRNLSLIDDAEKASKVKIKEVQSSFKLDEQKNVPLKTTIKKLRINKNQLEELKKYSIIETVGEGNNKEISELDLEILKIAKSLAKFGIEPRHLKNGKNYADKQALLIYQIVAPLSKNKKRFEEKVSDLISTSQAINKLLLKKSILELFGKK